MVRQHEEETTQGEIMRNPVLVSLGEGNQGTTIGPAGDNAAEKTVNSEYAAREVSRPEYRKRPTKRWVCVDGRVTAAKMETLDNEEADPQTAGGLPITEVSIEYMRDEKPKPVSKTLATMTRATIANGQEAIVHGDSHKHKAGCGCNKEQRNILRNNAAHTDVVTPAAWHFVQKLGIGEDVTIDEVRDMVTTGGENAENDELWDVTPEQKTDIIVANGGEYEELIEAHTEGITRADITEDAFDEAAFIRDHPNVVISGEALRAFNASFGLLKKYYYGLATEGKISKRTAAQRTAAAILHNLGTAKFLSNEDMQAVVIE